jgi:hypothetical protein
MQQPHNVVFSRDSSSGNSTTLQLAAPTILRLGTLFCTALYKIIYLLLFSISQDFYKITALLYCFFSSRAVARSIAFTLRFLSIRFFIATRSTFASNAIFFLYSIATALRSRLQVF